MGAAQGRDPRGYNPRVPRLFPMPEGLRVCVDGWWRVGEWAVAHADDGSGEPVADDSLGMSESSGRFECRVRGGRRIPVRT